MDLCLDQIAPRFFSNTERIVNSEVWGKSVVIPAGAQVFVHAPSGAGKTSLLHILYGLQRDYEGRVKWGDADLRNMTDGTLAVLRQESVSIVFQEMRLFPQLSTFQNIALKRLQKDTVQEKEVVAWMERLCISALRDRVAATLSRGEQQRVAIIRALSQPFMWLLLDEPFSHLDADNRERAIELVSEQLAVRNAGLIIADLDTNRYFNYTQTLKL